MEQSYFEFNKHEYYGLIAVNSEGKGSRIREATKIYVEMIGGESVDDVLMEGHPTKISEMEAFKKFVYAPNHQEDFVKTLIKQFEETKNNVLLIDGSLI